MSVTDEGKRSGKRPAGLVALGYLLYGAVCAALLGLVLLTGLQAVADERLLPLYLAGAVCALVPPLLLVAAGAGLGGGSGWSRPLAYLLPVALAPAAAA